MVYPISNYVYIVKISIMRPRPHLAPFSHNTSVMERQTNNNHDNSSTITKVQSAKKLSENIISFIYNIN